MYYVVLFWNASLRGKWSDDGQEKLQADGEKKEVGCKQAACRSPILLESRKASIQNMIGKETAYSQNPYYALLFANNVLPDIGIYIT